jgi:hypothetical protein
LRPSFNPNPPGENTSQQSKQSNRKKESLQYSRNFWSDCRKNLALEAYWQRNMQVQLNIKDKDEDGWELKKDN